MVVVRLAWSVVVGLAGLIKTALVGTHHHRRRHHLHFPRCDDKSRSLINLNAASPEINLDF